MVSNHIFLAPSQFLKVSVDDLHSSLGHVGSCQVAPKRKHGLRPVENYVSYKPLGTTFHHSQILRKFVGTSLNNDKQLRRVGS